MQITPGRAFEAVINYFGMKTGLFSIFRVELGATILSSHSKISLNKA
jgi:hypothetical protein